jgi:hypothetical protein
MWHHVVLYSALLLCLSLLQTHADMYERRTVIDRGVVVLGRWGRVTWALLAP